MQHEPDTADAIVGRIAGRSHGVVTKRQLLQAGITLAEIRVRLERGSLIAEHRGVYRVGHCAPSVSARYMAAVLAGGDGAVLSGFAAAHLHRLTRRGIAVAEITITGGRKIPGVNVCRVRRLEPIDVTTRDAIPITTVARTLVDLAAHLDEYELGRAVHDAGVLHRTGPEAVEAALARRPNSKGAGTLRSILRGETKITLSTLERRFLQRLRDARLPLPATNRRVARRYLDCRWPAHKLTVELDGYTYHASRHAWEQDREREREAYARGDAFRRYTWRDVNEAPDRMLEELRGLLQVS